jgi:hypothetical protein
LKIAAYGIQVVGGLSKALIFLAANPVVLVIAGVALLAAGLVIAYKKSETFRNIVDSVFRFLAKAVGAAVGAVLEMFRGMLNTWTNVIEGILRGTARFVRIFKPEWADAMERAADRVRGFRDDANAAIDKIKKTVNFDADTSRAREAVQNLQTWLKGRHFGPIKIPATVMLSKLADGLGMGAMGAAGGGLMGISPSSAVGRAYSSLGRPGDVISGYRPGARTLSGSLSYHAQGRALDITPEFGIALAIRNLFGGRTRELITPWPSMNMHNGRNYRYSDAVQAQHDGRTNVRHIHWAMGSGGVVNRPGSFLVGDATPSNPSGIEIVNLARGDSVTPLAAAGGGPTTINLVLDGRVLASAVVDITTRQTASAALHARKM